MKIYGDNTVAQAISHFGEVHSLYSTIHALEFRSNDDQQLKALLPIIIPKLEKRMETLIELAITQWNIAKNKG